MEIDHWSLEKDHWCLEMNYWSLEMDHGILEGCYWPLEMRLGSLEGKSGAFFDLEGEMRIIYQPHRHGKSIGKV